MTSKIGILIVICVIKVLSTCWRIGVRFPVGEGTSFRHHFQTDSGTDPAFQ